MKNMTIKVTVTIILFLILNVGTVKSQVGDQDIIKALDMVELPKSSQEGVVLMEKLAANGHPMAQFFIATFYDEGRLVGKDIKKAFYWASLSAEAGNADAQYYIADMIYTGDVDGDKNKASKLAILSAEQGHILAMYLVTKMERNPQFEVHLDLKQRLFYLLTVAESGSGGAYTDLGLIYAQGKDVDINYTKAREYWIKGASMGSESAKENLIALCKLDKQLCV